MYQDRAVSMIVQPDQWARCHHEHTALLADGGVELDWVEEPGDGRAGCDPQVRVPGGLVFDRWCHAYRSRPEAGLVEVVEAVEAGPAPGCRGGYRSPRALAVDDLDRLYVAEETGGSVLVVDLASRRALGRIAVPGRPVDLAVDGARVLVLTRDPDRLLVLEGRRPPRPGPGLVVPTASGDVHPVRVARGPVLLWDAAGTGLVQGRDGAVALVVESATDVEVGADGVLVVAGAPGQPLRCFRPRRTGWLELPPLAAPGFDGGAVAVMLDGRFAFTTATGFSPTTGSTAVRRTRGRVVGYRLDSQQYGTRWGRLLLDACLPVNTSVRVQVLTSDEDEVLDPVEARPAARAAYAVPYPETTPPLPSRSRLDLLPPPSAVFRPRARPDAGDTVTFESPVPAPPGRYLWVVLTLEGTRRLTPRVRALRVERPGHRLLDSLPRAWSRDEDDVDFLHRYLSPLEGFLHELDTRAAERARLLDPRVVPTELLDWLGSFAGLVTDLRWSEAGRRRLVAEAFQLFALRGSRAALERIVELYLDRPPTVVEQWQLRGLGGAVLGTAPGGEPAPAVGSSARATGTLGRFTIGGSAPSLDSFGSAAHRFSLLVPGTLTEEQRDVVVGILDVHRPAHTTYELCELGSGLQVGFRSRVGLTAYVGPGAQPAAAVVGTSRVGRDGLVGTRGVGSRVGSSTEVGRVRVG